MASNKNETAKYKGELSAEECIAKADDFINVNGMCLFLMDVVRSRQLALDQRIRLQQRLLVAMHDMNKQFAQYFPTNDLAVLRREETGFERVLSDGTWAGINSSEVIPLIIDYMHEHFPDTQFHYCIAKDGYDKEGTAIVR